MNILLTGSTGFVGRTVAAALTRAGHQVHGGVSPRHRSPGALQVPMDFARDTSAQAWLPRLAGIDAVVNAVGVLRDRRVLVHGINRARTAVAQYPHSVDHRIDTRQARQPGLCLSLIHI